MTETISEARAGSEIAPGRRGGLVMLCDVDLDVPDATRTHTVEVARGFARAGLAVDLIARGSDPCLPGVEYQAATGAEPERLKRLATINQQAIRRLWLRRRSAERFYVRDSWSCAPAVLAAAALGYRTVLQVDGIPYGPVAGEGSWRANAVKRLLALITGRLAVGQLAVTPQIKQLLVALARVPDERVAVVPNGVDLDFFAPLPREDALRRLGLDDRGRYIVFCGGFNPWTDFDAILAAFADVHRRQPAARLVLVGDGPERAAIEATIARLGIGGATSVTGMISDREQVRDYLAAATVTLLAYRPDRVGPTSASPIKLMEYLAMGRAVVAVDIDGVRELVQRPGAGLVVSDDPAELSRAILSLLDGDRADVCGAAARQVAEARLSWQRVIAETLPLFELGRPSPALVGDADEPGERRPAG